MKKLGVEIKIDKELKKADNKKLINLSLVLTGKLKKISRDRMKDIIRKNGGKISSSISRNTDFLLAGEAPGSKYKKAKKLGVKIISEKELFKLI